MCLAGNAKSECNSSQLIMLLTLLSASRVSPAPISHTVSIVTPCMSPLPPPITATKRCRKCSDGERCDILQRGTLTYFPCTTREKTKTEMGLKGEDGESEEEEEEWSRCRGNAREQSVENGRVNDGGRGKKSTEMRGKRIQVIMT